MSKKYLSIMKFREAIGSFYPGFFNFLTDRYFLLIFSDCMGTYILYEISNFGVYSYIRYRFAKEKPSSSKIPRDTYKSLTDIAVYSKI
jgi:hypothetical protein